MDANTTKDINIRYLFLISKEPIVQLLRRIAQRQLDEVSEIEKDAEKISTSSMKESAISIAKTKRSTVQILEAAIEELEHGECGEAVNKMLLLVNLEGRSSKSL